MSRLEQWAEKVIRAQRAEEPGHAVTIRLTSEGTVWETWQIAGLELATFLEEAQVAKGAIAEECPIRRVPLLWFAEDATGGTRATFPDSVQGKNKQADALAGSGNSAAKAFAEAMDGISKVVVAVLKSAEVQVTSLTKTLESQATQIHELIEYNRVAREAELVTTQAESETSKLIAAQVKEILPMIPAALEIWANQSKQDLAAQAAKAAQAVVSKTTNGVSTS